MPFSCTNFSHNSKQIKEKCSLLQASFLSWEICEIIKVTSTSKDYRKIVTGNRPCNNINLLSH